MTAVDLKLELGDDGHAKHAIAVSRIESPLERVWGVISTVERYPERVPMIHRVRFDGGRATMQLRFKVALFSVGFEFVVDVLMEKHRSVELRYVSGEPRGLRLGFELEELDGGAACLVRTRSQFDPTSLGWLAKYFLRHHPEIQYGIIPGVAIGLLESMRRASEGKPPP